MIRSQFRRISSSVKYTRLAVLLLFRARREEASATVQRMAILNKDLQDKLKLAAHAPAAIPSSNGHMASESTRQLPGDCRL